MFCYLLLRVSSGVYMISIDSKQQKVTVTGNVEPETLIKKLMRTGKHAEMWPMSPTENDQKPGNDNNKPGGEDTEAEDSDLGEEQQPPSDHQHGVRFFLGDQRPPNSNMMMQIGPLQGQAIPPPMNPSGGSSSGGGAKKKKKKKKKKSGTSGGGGGGGNNPPGPGGSGALLGPPQGHLPLGGVQMNTLPTCTGIQYHDLNGGYPNHSYPPQGHYQNQPIHMPLTTPVYSLSYNAVQPIRSHSPYYHNQAMQPYSYAYDEQESYTGGPVVPFDMINDENPNWCSIM